MGKALTNLKKSIKECYNEEEYEYDNDSEEEYEYQCDLAEEYVQKIENVSNQIKYALIKYSEESGFPLCEYLDIDNVKNFVIWLLEK